MVLCRYPWLGGIASIGVQIMWSGDVPPAGFRGEAPRSRKLFVAQVADFCMYSKVLWKIQHLYCTCITKIGIV